MSDADRRFRVHPLWRLQWERDEDSPYQRLSEPDIAWRFASASATPPWISARVSARTDRHSTT